MAKVIPDSMDFSAYMVETEAAVKVRKAADFAADLRDGGRRIRRRQAAKTGSKNENPFAHAGEISRLCKNFLGMIAVILHGGRGKRNSKGRSFLSNL